MIESTMKSSVLIVQILDLVKIIDFQIDLVWQLFTNIDFNANYSIGVYTKLPTTGINGKVTTHSNGLKACIVSQVIW